MSAHQKESTLGTVHTEESHACGAGHGLRNATITVRSAGVVESDDRSSASTTPADRLSDLRLQILERGLNKWSSTEQIQDHIVIKLHGPAGLMSLRILCYTLRVGQLQEMELSMHCHYFILGAAS